MKRVLILGGDGYLGWPTALHFSERGWEVTVVDNYLKRDSLKDLGINTLFETPDLLERAKVWKEVSGKDIKVVVGDLTRPEVLNGLFTGDTSYQWPKDIKWEGAPDTVIHYGEIPSAPFSMMDHQKSNLTITNNLLTTNNLIQTVKNFAPETHIIKLGTMGEYGTPNIEIEEGWIDIEHKGRKDKFLFPRQAGSIYHTTKIMDTDLLWFGVRIWGLKVTDLMQGPVYGIETAQTSRDPRLRTQFAYDEIFGTLINRFVTQAVQGFPLTVYGKGGQKRGYLNLVDTLQCLEIAAKNPASQGELRIFNQVVETFSVNEIAEKVQRVGKECGYDVKIESVENPRKENEDHFYQPVYQGFKELGIEPNLLTDEVLKGFFNLVEEHKSHIDPEQFLKGIKW